MDQAIRGERTVERFSRGLELVRAIHSVWDANELIPRIEALLREFDLTVPEWHYWANQAAEVGGLK